MSKTNICPKCNQIVYIPEKAAGRCGPNDWHKQCFKCHSCSKTLEGANFSEHDVKPYCKTCFDKNFRPKGYGFGVSNLSSYEAKAPAAAPAQPRHIGSNIAHNYAPAARPAAAPVNAAAAPRFCAQCGADLVIGANFCAKCGNKT